MAQGRIGRCRLSTEMVVEIKCNKTLLVRFFHMIKYRLRFKDRWEVSQKDSYLLLFLLGSR